jgi:hypothetical protein
MLRDIELMSRSATRQFEHARHDISAIGRELGARYIVGGTVRRFHDSVRITTQLEAVGTDRQVWGNAYKGKLDDIFDIQEQAAQQNARPSMPRPTISTARPGLPVLPDEAQRGARDSAVLKGVRAGPAVCGGLCRLFRSLRTDVLDVLAR